MANTPLHDRDGYIWMDGKMLPWRDAKVHFLTHGLHYGTQVFEGERAYNGTIFRSLDHSKRLLKSAELIMLDNPFTVEMIEQAKRETMEANKLQSCYLRASIWRGSEQMGLDPTGTLPHIAVAAWEWGSYFDAKIRDTGITLITSRWRKTAPDAAPIQAKTASLYNTGCIARLEAKAAGATEALMLDFEGYIAEATSSNLFAMKDGEIHTPTPDRFLNGLTRQTVLALAKDAGIKVHERRIKPEEMKNFDEVFLTGSAAEITAVGNIDGNHYQVGPITRKLRDAYSDYARSKPAVRKAS